MAKRMIVNIPEAKELVKRYRSVTREEVESVVRELARPSYSSVEDEFAYREADVKKTLTGFGDQRTCTLCIECKEEIKRMRSRQSICDHCLYNRHACRHGRCDTGTNRRTHEAVKRATTIDKYIKAIRARADLIEQTVKELEENENGT